MQKRVWVVCLSLSFFMFTGCSIARKILIRPEQGGIVAIPDSEAPRGKADSIMNEVCNGKKVKIVEERESLVGSVIEKQTDKVSEISLSNQDPKIGNSDTKHSREEHFPSRSEWRISFKCEP